MLRFASVTAAAALALSLAAPAPAQARNNGGAIVAGAVIGLAAGAILGSALAGGHRAPAHGAYGYAPQIHGYGYGHGPQVRYVRPAARYHAQPYAAGPYGYAPAYGHGPRRVYWLD
jgi:hypothetical protein